MKWLLYILSRPKSAHSFQQVSLSLLMGLIVLWPFAAPSVATGATIAQARLTPQVRRLWERDMPFILRSMGIIPQPPEYVAQQVLFALDRRDTAGVMKFVDHSAPSAHQDISEVLHRWPANTLRQPGCWGRIGPYEQEGWFAVPPEGSVRRIPLTLSSPRGTNELILLFRFNGRTWQIASAHHRQTDP